MTAYDQTYGEWIRAERQEKGLSLTDVSRATRIDRQYLEALEAGNIALLPEPYMRAFLKTYAAYLGLDGTEAVGRFETFIHDQEERLEHIRSTVRDKDGRRAAPAPARESGREVPAEGSAFRPPRERRPTRRWPRLLVPLGLLIAVGAVVAIGLAGPSGDGRGNTAAQPPLDPGPSVADQPAVASAEAPAERQEAATAAPPPAAEPRIDQMLVAEALEDTWMQAIADGRLMVSRTVTAGTRVEVSFADTLEVKLGKNRGMRLFFNDSELTDLGAPGFVLTLLLTPQGVVRRRLTYPPETIPDILTIPPLR